MARLQVLLAALCFGTTGTAQALGPDGIDPAAVGAARIACGGALLVLFALLVRRGARAALGAGPVLAGAPASPPTRLSFFAAVDDTGVAVGTIVALGSAPALTGALEWLLHGRRPPGRWAAATALACAGVALLALGGGGGGRLAARRRPRRDRRRPPTPPTRSPPSGCSRTATRPRA